MMLGNVLLVTTLLCLGVRGGDYFNCGRQGQDCANGQTCQADGNCDCKTPYSGHDCKLQNDTNGKAPCTSVTDSCGSDGGLCYNNGGDKACHCPPASFGAHCEHKRYDVQCLASSMKIKLLPAGTFSGVVYVDGQRDVAGCKTTETSASGYLELDLQDSSCGEVTSDTNTGAWSRAVVVQYNSKYVTNLDTKVTVTCRNEAGTVEVTQTFSSENSDGNIHEQNINSSVDIDSSAVEFEIKQKDGTSVSSSAAVSLDDQLAFEFVGKQTCTYRKYPKKTGSWTGLYVMTVVTDLASCEAVCTSDPTCVSFDFLVINGIVGCFKYNESVVDRLTEIFIDHYEKDCSSGSNSCSFIEYPGKKGPYDELENPVHDVTECKTMCENETSCTAIDFSKVDNIITCYRYTKRVVNVLTDVIVNHYTKQCSGYAIRVESCTASNGQSGQDQETLNIIEDSCPSGEVGKLMEEAPTKVTDNTVTFKLHPFKFNKVNAITVTCTVKVCPAGTAAECEALNCSSQPNRKRRSTEISDETVRKTFIILDPNLEFTSHDSSKKSSVSVNDVTTPIVAGVAMVIIMLLVVSIVVLLVVKKRRSNRKFQEDGVNKQTI